MTDRPSRRTTRRTVARTATATIAATAAMSLLALSACGSGGGADSAGDASDGGGAGGDKKVTVFAAASLTTVYERLEATFEKENPGVDVVLSTGGSSDLVTQMEQGAPADVFASADEKNMDRAVESSLISGEPTPFATNELTIAVQPGNPHGIASLSDLENPDLSVVRCAVPVPCGSVSDAVLSDAGVTVTAASEENSVTDVLGKVTAGEADAGLVYVTDVARSEGAAESVEIPEAADHRTTYPIAVTSGAADPDLAQKFVDLVTGPEGQKALADAGFGTP